MLSHGNLLHNASLVHRALDHVPTDKYISWLPTCHDMGFMAGVLQPLYGGFPVVLMSPAAGHRLEGASLFLPVLNQAGDDSLSVHVQAAAGAVKHLHPNPPLPVTVREPD